MVKSEMIFSLLVNRSWKYFTLKNCNLSKREIVGGQCPEVLPDSNFSETPSSLRNPKSGHKNICLELLTGWVVIKVFKNQ